MGLFVEYADCVWMKILYSILIILGVRLITEKKSLLTPQCNNKANYRPINLLPIISKIFERVLFEQIEKFSEKMLSPKLCGFRKGHSTQHALLNLLKNWQKTLDKSGVIGTILMDLSKAYDCLPHDLVIAKLAAYGCKDSTTSLISDYLSKRYKRVKIGFLFLT